MSAIYVNLELKVLNAIVLHHVRFRCSGVFRWCYIGAPLVFRGFPLLFGSILLFRHYSGVFRCSAGVPCSGVPGFIVCLVDMWKEHMWTSGFYRYEHTYSYKRQEFQNILEINLCNCFGQLLLIYLKKC